MEVLRVLMKRSGMPLGVRQRRTGEVFASVAARSGRNQCAVRAGARVAQKRANLVGGFGGEDVLELAGLLLDLGLAVHGKAVGEQAFRQSVATDDVGGALTAAGRELHDQAAIADGDSGWLESVVARIHKRLVVVGLGGMWLRGDQAQRRHLFHCDAYRERSVYFHAADLGDFAVFFQGPEFLEYLVELFLVGHGEDFLDRDLAMV